VLTLRHTLGREDLEEAHQRANPSRADCLDMINRLQARRIEVTGTRSEVASRARAAYAIGLSAECATLTRRLRALDAELGTIESSLDRILELLRPGAERQAVRRTRDASIALGRARLKAIFALLEKAGVPNAANRIQVTNPRFVMPTDDRPGVITITPGRAKVQA